MLSSKQWPAYVVELARQVKRAGREVDISMDVRGRGAHEVRIRVVEEQQQPTDLHV